MPSDTFCILTGQPIGTRTLPRNGTQRRQMSGARESLPVLVVAAPKGIVKATPPEEVETVAQLAALERLKVLHVVGCQRRVHALAVLVPQRHRRRRGHRCRCSRLWGSRWAGLRGVDDWGYRHGWRFGGGHGVRS